jgi:glycosyltransferase involved in cell wall biosynthesis
MPSQPQSLSILHLALGRRMRGGERQVRLLHEGLLDRGMRSLLVVRKGSALAIADVAHREILPWRGEWDLAGLWHLAGVCRRERPQCIHCHDNHAFNHGIIAGALLGIPVLVTRRVLFSSNISPFDKWKFERCAKVVAVSSAVAEECRKMADEDKIEIVHSAVMWEPSGLAVREARSALGIPETCFSIGTVGHFTSEKNVRLIEYLADRLYQERPSARIVCVGPMELKIARLLSRCSNVITPGLMEKAADYYAAFNLYMSTSRKEGLGTALLDAIVRDIPAIATNAGGTIDLFPQGWNLAPYGDSEQFARMAIDAIDNYRAAQDRAALAGKRAREMFSHGRLVDKMIQIYTEISLRKAATA